eukprot:768496-Hanusia_phi.AAC.1
MDIEARNGRSSRQSQVGTEVNYGFRPIKYQEASVVLNKLCGRKDIKTNIPLLASVSTSSAAFAMPALTLLPPV